MHGMAQMWNECNVGYSKWKSLIFPITEILFIRHLKDSIEFNGV